MANWHIHDDLGVGRNGRWRVDLIEYPVGSSGDALRNIYLHDLLDNMNRLSVYGDEMGHLFQIYRNRDPDAETGGQLVWHIHGNGGAPNGPTEFKVVAPGVCGTASSSSSSSIDCNGILVKEIRNRFDVMGHWYSSGNCVTSVTLHTMPPGYGGCSIEAYTFPDEIDPISSSGSSSNDCYPCVTRNRIFNLVRLSWGEEGHLRKGIRLSQFTYPQIINTVCDSAGAVRDPCCTDDFGDALYVNYTCRNLNVAMEFTCTSSPLVYETGSGIISYDDANGWWQGDITLGCVGTLTIKMLCQSTGVGLCEYRRRVYADGVEATQALSEGDAPTCCPVDFTAGWTGWTSHSCDCGIPPTPGVPGTLSIHIYECVL